MEEQVEQKMNEKPRLAGAIAAELMMGFWFRVGAILAVKMVSSLEELISRKSGYCQ